MSDVDHNPFTTPNPDERTNTPVQEAVPHAGKQSWELPVREFDKTTLQEAVDQERITVPESPAPLVEPTPEPAPQKTNRGAKIFGAIAAVAAIGGGAFALGSKSGGNETETAERPAATAAPSPTAQPEQDLEAPVVVTTPSPVTQAPAQETPITTVGADEVEETPSTELPSGAVIYNEYLPSTTDFHGYDAMTEDNMRLYESPELTSAVEKYGLDMIHDGYESYYQNGPMVGDFAWWNLYPNKHVDASRLGSEIVLDETTMRELAPVYMHNYIMAYNTSQPEILGNIESMDDGGTSNFPDIIILPTAETYARQPQIEMAGDRAVLTFTEVPMKATLVEKIEPLAVSGGGTSPDDWTMKHLVLEIDTATGRVIDYDRLAEENS